jgi:anti-sigma factor RsiW
MTEETGKSNDGAGLWARARDGWREVAARTQAPDPMTLAAYLDGALEPEARARVEAWMAVSPEGLDFMVAARAAATAAPAPDGLVRRAQGLVREPAPPRAGLGAWLSGLVAFRVDAWRPLAWAGVTAALLVISASGFELGRLGALQLVEVQTTSTDDLGFGLSDPADDLL